MTALRLRRSHQRSRHPVRSASTGVCACLPDITPGETWGRLRAPGGTRNQRGCRRNRSVEPEATGTGARTDFSRGHPRTVHARSHRDRSRGVVA